MTPFEEWWEQVVSKPNPEYKRTGCLEPCRAAWDASRSAALDEAELVCREASDAHYRGDRTADAEYCADAIRALKTATRGGG